MISLIVEFSNLISSASIKASYKLLSLILFVTLAMIDEFWKEHLREMDELKQSVQNAVYEQKDPLLIYKFEAIAFAKYFSRNKTREKERERKSKAVSAKDRSIYNNFMYAYIYTYVSIRIAVVGIIKLNRGFPRWGNTIHKLSTETSEN